MSTPTYDLRGKRVFVAGHKGMVGGALCRRLRAIDCDVMVASRKEADLCRQNDVERWFVAKRPQAVFLAAAKVGGIMANQTFPAEFLYENLAIAANVIHAAHQFGVEKLMFLGSSCIYPKFAKQPIDEAELLTGPLEPTNEPYAIAKIAGLKMAESYRRQYGCDFISVMPTNLYGPGDNYHPEHSHVAAALLRRIHQAKVERQPTVVVWGTGSPRREFLYVDDLADACTHLMQTYSDAGAVNIGTGRDVTIRELAELIAGVVGYEGSLVFDTSKPDGTPRKLLDVGKLERLGWTAQTELRDGLRLTYRAFLETQSAGAVPH